MFIEFSIDNLKDFPNKLEKLLNNQKEQIDKIAKEATNYNESIKKLEDLDEELERFFTPLSHLNSVLNSKETQEAYENSIPLLSKFSSYISSHNELYEKIKSIVDSNDLEKRVLKLLKRDFLLSGAELNRENKEKLEEINLKLSELSNNFSQNLLDATKEFELIVTDPKDLEGMPKNELEQAKIEENGELKYKFTLQIPSFLAYMTYGINREFREKLYKAYNTRAPQNQEVIEQILELKYKKSKILGFKSYSHYALETRDASSCEDVIGFLEELLQLSKNQAKKEVSELEEFANKLDGIEKLESYDVAYYSQKFKREKFNYEESDTKPYFELNNTLNGMLNLVSKLFSVEFKEVDVKTWHSDVKVYDISNNNKPFARIYFDLEARDTKRGGAWMHNWQGHFVDSCGQENLASAFVVCNFAPSSKDLPSLLRHDDVVTLFHEMGHAIHHLFSKVPQRHISGIEGVAWDVVEFPSQFLENFAYEKQIVKEFGYHHKTREPISDELLTKIKRSKNFQAATGILRQLEFSLFDFKLHQKLYKGFEISKLLDTIREETSIIKPPSYVKFEHGFAHIFAGGYAAGYYSYKWAEVFSADAFFACLEDGNFNLQKAKEYKENILEKGATKEMSTLYKEWLGNRPNSKSLIKLYEIEDAKS